ncbi:MAG: FtsX-like permease family protein [Gemmatimonadetes bacterium]|nr:ABC transporter permease [Gemmatimonadota bacterium]NIR77141.1 ABC transporter permease [Gemmatimonadota bacterium]NIT85656.1 ABC transporter permease [Gemmatimonadota bacterium]NIU29488.1 ABC transporter permease [Gemmatimonadota bacterium]NIU34542.1 FtsX-like permease family protein [Gemmatimonadota bacterium]
MGRTLALGGRPRTVVGVMPEGFDIPSPWGDPDQDHDVFFPFARSSLEQNRGSHWFFVLGRLAEGTGLEAARADVAAIMERLAEAYPDTNAGRGVRVTAMHEDLYGRAGRRLFLVLGAAGLLLLVGCGNVAGVQLARATSRRRELAIRTALGAGRLRVARELLAESLLLAAVGGALGVLLAWAGLEGLRSILAASLPRVAGVGLDPAMLAFAAGASLLTAVVFGAAPALTVRRMDLATPLREGGDRGSSDGREGLRSAFIVGQLALSLVLANGAGLLLRSYANLRAEERGFDPSGVLTFTATAEGPAYEDPLVRARYFERVRERVAATPGVEAVGAATKLPWYGGSNSNVRIEGRPVPEVREDAPLVEITGVQGGYFRAMGIPLVRGRALLPEDSASGSPGVVVNRTLAERFWPGEDPLGRRFSFSFDEPSWLTVVGVVEDVRQWGAERPVLPEAYRPYTANPWYQLYLTVRTRGEPAALVEPVRRAAASVDPTLPPAEFRTMEERVDRRLGERRSYTGLVGLFAAIAVLLAATGVYGTVSYFVARRTREIGVRMALGSSPGRVVALVGSRAGRLAVSGVALGVLGALGARRVVSSVVYGIGAVDAVTLVLTAGALLVTVLVGSAVPSLRAASVQPSVALREE